MPYWTMLTSRLHKLWKSARLCQILHVCVTPTTDSEYTLLLMRATTSPFPDGGQTVSLTAIALTSASRQGPGKGTPIMVVPRSL